MKKLLIGVALGMVAGCLIADNPKVQTVIDSGKRKIKKMCK